MSAHAATAAGQAWTGRLGSARPDVVETMIPRGSTGCRGRAGTGASCSRSAITWVLDGLEVTLVGSIGSVLERPGHARPHAAAGRLGRLALRRRRGDRRARLRPPDRPPRAQAAVPGHARRLPGRHRRHGVLAWDFWSFAVFRFAHRRRHRRRVRGDQLGDRRADPGARARPRRPRDQRQLLDRRGARRGADASCCSTRACSAPRSAGAPASCSARCSRWRSCSCAATCPRARAGCSRTAAATRPSASSREIEAQRARGAPAAARAARREPHRDRQRGALGFARRRGTCCCGATRSAALLGAGADDRAGVLLQRDLLHLRAGADRFYGVDADAGRRSTSCRSRSATCSGRCCSARCSTASGGA